ncbi:TetR family transcriptional regulator [Streptomyces sp. NPDC059837]|jgi:AcrR family transcriptional regulator|uniref:acyl-CoA-like ligand-binding transcription factor n=1 Tax=unclassified Streptomyces TaxID=2593676 RepID=UPI00225AF4C3|nr:MULTISPECIES: TetR family transcriptional regulator [unclassified Streptomyces]MCX4403616.1 TetR family transcriptional regulator [Streptomyces sp. NBC_01764]MCX5181430.1 TetR family transcriptional regulator [Streptomyces sp. NBC_00268]
MTTHETSAAPLGLRERKKQKTRERIRHEAYRLFAEHGYEATTVDQIADAAEVSPSTFFRYFPTKEDVVIQDEYDPALAQALRARPADEPIVEAIVSSLKGPMGQMLQQDREDLLLRTRLTFSDPAIRARNVAEQERSERTIADLIAERTGRAPGDLEVKCAAAAIIAVFTALVRHWAESDGQEDLAALYERHLPLLSRGLDF